GPAAHGQPRNAGAGAVGVNMPLRFLFRHWRALLTWSVYVMLLAGIGAALYVALPPAPRWRVTGPLRSFLTDDGPALATFVMQAGGVKPGGAVQFWDMETGREQQRFLGDEPAFLAHGQSPDGRYFVAVVPGAQPDSRRIVRIDVQDRVERQVEA